MFAAWLVVQHCAQRHQTTEPCAPRLFPEPLAQAFPQQAHLPIQGHLRLRRKGRPRQFLHHAIPVKGRQVTLRGEPGGLHILGSAAFCARWLHLPPAMAVQDTSIPCSGPLPERLQDFVA
eukprot:3673304-Alexandrium_andersonii.AAC.1